MKAASFCIVQLGRIGDLILTTPVFEAIKKDNPNHRISVLCGRNNFKFAESYPLIDDVYVYWKKPIALFQLLFSLRKQRFDYWIDPKDHSSGESKFFASVCGAKTKIGYNGSNSTVFNIPVPSAEEQYDVHVIKRYLNPLNQIGISADRFAPKLYLNSLSEHHLNTFLAEHKLTDYVHINISASLDERYWVDEKWIELEHQISDTSDTLFSCDPKDTERLDRIVAKCKRAKRYPTKSLEDVYSLAHHARCVISPDTAVVHIASAFNTPVVGLYANRKWNLKKFPPSSAHYKLVINECSDTFIKDISVQDVLKAYNELMERIS